MNPPHTWLAASWMLLGALCTFTLVAAEPKRRFDLPAGDATETLPRFAQQADREIVFAPSTVRGVKTNAVVGEFAPAVALNRLLAQTLLVATQDTTSGAFSVRKETRAVSTGAGTTSHVTGSTEPAARAVSAAKNIGGTGVIVGRVSNAGTHANLESAMVVVEDTPFSAKTESDGTYRLEVPPGDYQLTVSYTGLDPQRVSLVVEPHTTTRRDFPLTSNIYQLEKMMVTGEREGNALAITLQRQSDGIRSVVAADALGSLAGSVASLIMRLPGVEGESVGGDIRFIRIRGMHQNLGTATLDGNRIASATVGNTRETQFQSVGSDALARIEVIKSPTPDMDGDSIGGAVNMVSKSAFDSSPERRISGSFGAAARILDPRDRSPHRHYSVAYSEIFKGKLGVSLDLAYRPHMAIADNTILSHQLLPNGVVGPAYTNSVFIRDFRTERTRSGGGLKLDYKLSEQSRFFVNWTLNHHKEKSWNTQTTWATGAAIATRDANGNFTGTGGIIPGYTDSRTEIRPVNSSTLTLGSDYSFFYANTMTVRAGAVHRFKNFQVDYDAYQSKAKIDLPGSRTLNFIVRNIGFTIEKGEDKFFPYITQTAGPDVGNVASYTENSYSITRQATWDRFRGMSFNAKKDFRIVVPSYLKVGFRQRSQQRKFENNPWSGQYLGPDGVMGVNAGTGANDDDLGQFGQALQRFESDRLKRYRSLPWPAFQARAGNFSVDTLLANSPQNFRRNVAGNLQTTLMGNQIFDETITGYYAMGAVTLGKLSILAGVRIETTSVEGEGALQAISSEERARRAAWVGPVTDAELIRRTIAEFSGRVRRDGEYRDVLPGVHFKWEPWRRLVTRFSFAQNIGRPGIAQLIPRTNVNFENRTVSSSNPELKPQTANNFDLSAEYYFEPAGVVSIGVFLKEMKRFIYTAGGVFVAEGPINGFGGDYAGFELTTQNNGGSAKIKGIELGYSQQFTFLPGFWSGLGAFANFTGLDAKGNYGTGTAIALTPNPKLAGFCPVNANIGVSYIKNRVSLRVHYNYRGRYLATYNTSESRMVYRIARPTIDIKTSYGFSKRLSFYLNVTNVTATIDRGQEFGGGRAADALWMSPQFFFGLEARM